MRIAIVGAGIVGVTTAYELAADGHEVIVYERRGTVAVEASFAHAGLVSPALAAPWSLPGSVGSTFRGLFQRGAPWRVQASPSALGWMNAAWRAGRGAGAAAHRQRAQQLTAYSRDRLHALTRALKLDYERSDGHLVLLRTARDHARFEPRLAWLAERGVPFSALDAAQCLAIEPGLNPDTPLHGGVHLPGDEVGNCRQFALLMRTEAERLGAQFRFHWSVRSIEPGKRPRLTAVHAPHDETTMLSSSPDAPVVQAFQVTVPLDEPVAEAFDAIVVCAAIGAPALLAPHGLRMPLAQVHGLSVTTPLRHHEAHPDIGPRSAITDQQHQVVVSRLGGRLRVTGGARLGGDVHRNDPETLERLYQVLNDWFPGAGHMSQTQRWRGTRAMLPDGEPVLGPCSVPGVWLNLGHGSSGWAMACGSARVLADTMSGRKPSIDTDGLGADRLKH